MADGDVVASGRVLLQRSAPERDVVVAAGEVEERAVAERDVLVTDGEVGHHRLAEGDVGVAAVGCVEEGPATAGDVVQAVVVDAADIGACLRAPAGKADRGDQAERDRERRRGAPGSAVAHARRGGRGRVTGAGTRLGGHG